MKSAVVVFPGSNCDRDAYTTLRDVGLNPSYVWHGDSSLPDGLDVIVLPGGFSYGDYLRCGAMAARSPIMREVIAYATKGGHVIGICNGFQVLCETGLVPGTLMRNRHLKFNCHNTNLRVESNDSAFLSGYKKGQVVNFPVAHAEGNYFADADTLKRLNDNGQVALRYVDAAGKPSDEGNPNGAVENIAGITNEKKNVLGLMPHPERHADPELGGSDGRILFESVLKKFAA
ncbi:MAG: phosphoribosylformylglycinamidine synthase subunit PurQ [Alphaproteobacteria bacterium]|nr:phosphoribosylformylglycinamidine synthase subunit PurQ [Alphaproteobacteria bacterium]